MRFDVVCFGALNMDRLYKVNSIAKAGEESEILDFEEAPGGSAANTAAGLARLGVRTGFIGKVAEDREGHLLLNAFREEGVNTNGVIVCKNGRSGMITGLVDQKGERALYLDPGVNNSLEFNEIKLEFVSCTSFLHLTSFAGDRPFEAQQKLVDALPNIKVTLDPGMLYAQKGLNGLGPLIRRCFSMFPNERELRLITGTGYRKGAEALMQAGVKIVAVKLGARGCYVTDGEEHRLIEPFRVNVVDSTGAGDAFCAGFLYGLLKKMTLKECGLLGNFAASRVLTKMGARNGLPRKEDLPF